jgi:5-methyltetrahydropteroyltriglutamate--homocysteine methyltransferase
MIRSAGGQLPQLPTTVVGSYSVPEWLERLKTEYYQRRISAAHLAEIHEVAIKAAVNDQERAGIDIVSDGELRRDNDIDYFLARIPGVHIAQRAKADYYDYYDAAITSPLPEDDKQPSLGGATPRTPRDMSDGMAGRLYRTCRGSGSPVTSSLSAR